MSKNSKNVEIEPSLISGALSRYLESLRAKNKDIDDINQPDSIENARALPHQGIRLGIGILAGILTGGLSYLILPDLTGILELIITGAIILATVTVISSISGIYFLYKELSNRKYVIKEDSIEIIDDYLDKSRKSTSFENVTDVRLERPLLQRVFGTGNVNLNTAGSDIEEFKLEFVKNSDVLQKEISEIISETEYRQNHNER